MRSSIIVALLLLALFGYSRVEGEEAQSFYAALAKQIVNEQGIKEGNCVEVDCGDASFSLELARITDLRIYGLEIDPKAVDAAQKAVDKADLYGRITLEHGEVKSLPFPDFFTHLVINYDSFKRWEEKRTAVAEIYRILRPGGVAVLVSKGISDAEKKEWQAVLSELKEFKSQTISEGDRFWIRINRPEATDTWPMFCYDAANTFASPDRVIKPPLKLLWVHPGGARGHHNNFNLHPVVANDMVYTWSGTAIALDAYTGKVKWRTQEEVEGFLAAAEGLIIGFKDDYSGLIALDAFTGEKKWSYQLKDDKMIYLGFPVVAGGLVYFRTENGIIHAVNIPDGRGKWTCEVGKKGSFSPAVSQGVVYQASGSGKLYAVQASDGKVLWTKPIPIQSAESIAVYKGKLFVYQMGSPTSSKIVCIDSKDGSTVWVNNSAGNSRWLCFTGDNVYTQLYGLVAYGISDGKEKWRRVQGGCGPVVYANGHLFGAIWRGRDERTGDWNFPFVAVDANTGKLAWKDKATASYHSCVGAVIANGISYVATRRGVIYAFTSEKESGK